MAEERSSEGCSDVFLCAKFEEAFDNWEHWNRLYKIMSSQFVRIYSTYMYVFF